MEDRSTAAVATTGTRQVAAGENIAAEVVEMFLAQHDAADSSIELYRRALRQFFAWVDKRDAIRRA